MAAGDILIVDGTPITFGTGADVAMTMTNLIDGAGRQSNQQNMGITPRTNLYRLRAEFVPQAGVNEEAGIDVYMKRSPDGVVADNDENGLVDAAATEGKQRNCLYLGTAIVDASSGTPLMVLAIDELLMSDQFFQMVIINKSGATLSSNANELTITVTPLVYQGQSS